MTFLISIGKMAFGVVCVIVLWEYLGPHLLKIDELASRITTLNDAAQSSIELLAEQLQALSKMAQENHKALELLLQSTGTGPLHPAGEDGAGGGKRM